MQKIKLKYKIGEKYILNDNTLVKVKSIHIYISNFVIGYQLYVTNLTTNKSYYISEKEIYQKY